MRNANHPSPYILSPEGRGTGEGQSDIRKRNGFTLIELAVVIVIMGIMIALIGPRLGELGEANLKRSARHLTGMIRFLHEEAQAKKMEYRLVFDIQDGRYWPEAWVSTSDNTRELKKVSSVIAGEGSLAGQTKFKDIMAGSHPDEPYILFTPDGWVDSTLIHLQDGDDHDYTLKVKPLTGDTELHEGYLEER